VCHGLTAQRLRRGTAQEGMGCLQAPALPAAPGVLAAAQGHWECLLPGLRGLAAPLRRCTQQVEAVLSPLTEPDEAGGPSARAMVPSLPGVGRKITAWVCAEAAPALRDRTAQGLRPPGGVAPGTKPSGKRRPVVRRRGCPPRLRHALEHLARVAAHRDGHCGVVDEALRAKGQRHGHAFRNLGDRLRRMLIARVRDRPGDDATRHRREPVVLMGEKCDKVGVTKGRQAAARQAKPRTMRSPEAGWPCKSVPWVS
jgi:hypothetical protein